MSDKVYHMSALRISLYRALSPAVFIKTIVQATIDDSTIDYNQIRQAIAEYGFVAIEKTINLEDHPDLETILSVLVEINKIENKKLRELLKQTYLSHVIGLE